MTTTEAAARLGLSPITVRRHIERGHLKAVKRGRDWWIEEAEVERFATERRPAHRPRAAQARGEGSE